MQELRLRWEPESISDANQVKRQVMKYMDNTVTFAQFKNSTCLMLKPVPNLNETIEGVMQEARKMTNFEVYPMEEGDYLVFFANPLIVYVGKEEFKTVRDSIKRRISDLSFPSENIVSVNQEADETNLLVGLYARGKLQKDAWDKLEFSIVSP